MTKQLLSKIEGCYSSMSKGHKRITDYITENYDMAAFMTAAKLGDAVGVSESTVVRFASELGFSGYPQLQKALQEVVKSRLTSVQRMEAAGGEDMLEHAFSSDIDTIKATRESISREAFNASVEAINRAKHIYVLGVRSAASLASFAAFYLNFVYDSVTLIEPAGTGEAFDQAFRINKDDVCIEIFKADDKYAALYIRQGSDGYLRYRQRKFAYSAVCDPSSPRAQQHGLVRRFPRCSAEPYQRADSGGGERKERRGLQQSQLARKYLGRVSDIPDPRGRVNFSKRGKLCLKCL